MFTAILSLALALGNVQASPSALGKPRNYTQHQCRFDFDRFPILEEMLILEGIWKERPASSAGWPWKEWKTKPWVQFIDEAKIFMEPLNSLFKPNESETAVEKLSHITTPGCCFHQRRVLRFYDTTVYRISQCVHGIPIGKEEGSIRISNENVIFSFHIRLYEENLPTRNPFDDHRLINPLEALREATRKMKFKIPLEKAIVERGHEFNNFRIKGPYVTSGTKEEKKWRKWSHKWGDSSERSRGKDDDISISARLEYIHKKGCGLVPHWYLEMTQDLGAYAYVDAYTNRTYQIGPSDPEAIEDDTYEGEEFNAIDWRRV
ncbi:hypothetical protein S7711_11006 [Stachybotrys chartarum IBT 7711]|uniref:FTP domain-containing protein n=1 Tax=Stachybotrys chartarum (strain CBS 109288 / IBT 7711) TaxID=1280523 RepID=A0A084B8L6_STACB|nr:hypothetical protein S7711_11006 [Stachybotrys chartarum IBT 7711]